jgi:hypothetical protein
MRAPTGPSRRSRGLERRDGPVGARIAPGEARADDRPGGGGERQRDGAIVCAGLAWRDARANRAIAALEAGTDRAVGAEASETWARPRRSAEPVRSRAARSGSASSNRSRAARKLLARIRFLAARERFEEAEPLLAALDRTGSADLRGLNLASQASGRRVSARR